MTEPDAQIYKPLNLKADELKYDDEEPETSGSAQSWQNSDGSRDNFVEDPAIIRAKLERKRMEKFQHHKGTNQPRAERDVVGESFFYSSEYYLHLEFAVGLVNWNRSLGFDSSFCTY